MNFDHSFQTLPSFFYEHVKPTPLTAAKLIHSTTLRETLGLSLSDDELVAWLNGEKQLIGEQRIATRYAGHQFGVWAGQLGDGRAISLGEVLTSNGRLEIQTKGSGVTPFSRMGDGKAVVRSSVREYLCSEAMHGLGIPTTRVLALFTGEDDVRREEMEKAAIVARVFPSNLRFGHFEMAYHFDRRNELQELIEYTSKTLFNGATPLEMLKVIVERTAKLMAMWQSVGFCHGVMNTDNMSILGLTMDYGPFGMMEDTVLNYVCNHSDHHGRYAYNQQPSIGMWNLERLLVCFIGIVSKEVLQDILNSYPKTYQDFYLQLAREKLGFKENKTGDHELYVDLLKTMHTYSIDFTFLFRQLSHYEVGHPESLAGVWGHYGNREDLKKWLHLYDERLRQESSSNIERQSRMKKVNPKFILRNYIAQEIIDDVQEGGRHKLKAWLEILYSPYDEHSDYEKYALPTPPAHKNYVVSCSS